MIFRLVLAQGTNDLSEAVPLLADLLSIPTGDHYPPLNVTPQKRKEKTLHALLAQLGGLTARQPVLMVWEDVHWSDPTTREALDLLIDRVPTLQVLVILTFRPEFTPPWLGRPHVTMLTLNRLPRRQGAEMVAYATGSKALPKEIAEQIIDRTDGVPLFIEELTKTVVESGIVIEAGDHYGLAGQMGPLAIPTSLQASLLARLDRLAPTREVAQVGAAFGRSFSYELISAVVEMSQQKLDEALAQLASAELIFGRGVPPDAEYTFKHALVQDAAYSTLLRSRRQQIHARIATTMENQFPEIVVAQPQLLAQHCAEAGLNEKAVSYWLRAGQQAIAHSAMTEAVAQLQKGLNLLPILPDDPWRQQHELDLQLSNAQALLATKGYAASAVGEAYRRARALADLLDRSDYVPPLLHGLWAFHMVRGELKLSVELAGQMEALGQSTGNSAALPLGKEEHGISCFWRGDFSAAREHFGRCCELSDPVHRAVYAAWSIHDQHNQMLMYLANTLACQGYINQARARVNEALIDARELRHTLTLTVALCFAALVARTNGLPREEHEYAKELLALSHQEGFVLYEAIGNFLQGESLTARGQTEEGSNLIANSLSMMRATGAMLFTPTPLTALAQAHGALNRPLEGLNLLREAAQIMDITGERWNEAGMLRLRGELLLATGDQDAAEKNYYQALVVAQQQNAKTLELRSAASLARLRRDQGKRTEARDALAPVYGWFTEGLNTPVLREATELLGELG